MNFIYKSHAKVAPSTSLTIGNFDGVHKGHQRLFDHIKSNAHQPAVLTFWPNPRGYFNKDFIPINSLDEKIHNFNLYGIDQVFVLNFDHELSQMSADDFISKLLLNDLFPENISLGEDFRFGKNAQGDAAYLKNYLNGQINVNILPLFNKTAYSSTEARAKLIDGNFAELSNILGRQYNFIGIAVSEAGSFKIKRKLKLKIKNMKFSANISCENLQYIATCRIKEGNCFIDSLPDNLIGKKIIITPNFNFIQ